LRLCVATWQGTIFFKNLFRLFAADTCGETNRLECLDWHSGKMASYSPDLAIFQVH
jgi:hypothetical protein